MSSSAREHTAAALDREANSVRAALLSYLRDGPDDETSLSMRARLANLCASARELRAVRDT